MIGTTLRETVRQHALEAGFDLVGIAPLDVAGDLDFSRRWVEQGRAGEMHYLENPKRTDARRVLPSAKSVVCVGLVYNAPRQYSEEIRNQNSEVRRQELKVEIRKSKSETRNCPTRDCHSSETTDEGPRAWISRYAWGRDYHRVMRSKLERLRAAIEELAGGVKTRVFVDTGPVVERAFARFSGIGWMGKNTCLINEGKGSWFFLGVILTSLELEPDLPAPDRCGSCTRCLEACPTGALVEPYVMDASRCIAYFTIELKGSIPAEFRPAIGSNVFGCDICQDVCPWNGRGQDSGVRSQNETPRAGARAAATTSLPEFHPLEVAVPNPGPRAPGSFSLFNPPLDALASLTEDQFHEVFRHSPIKRAHYVGWLRNLCVAMGNSGDARFLPRLRALAEHPDALLREHATWALGRIENRVERSAD